MACWTDDVIRRGNMFVCLFYTVNWRNNKLLLPHNLYSGTNNIALFSKGLFAFFVLLAPFYWDQTNRISIPTSTSRVLQFFALCFTLPKFCHQYTATFRLGPVLCGIKNFTFFTAFKIVTKLLLTNGFKKLGRVSSNTIGSLSMSPVSPIFHIASTVNSWSQTCSWTINT